MSTQMSEEVRRDFSQELRPRCAWLPSLHSLFTSKVCSLHRPCSLAEMKRREIPNSWEIETSLSLPPSSPIGNGPSASLMRMSYGHLARYQGMRERRLLEAVSSEKYDVKSVRRYVRRNTVYLGPMTTCFRKNPHSGRIHTASKPICPTKMRFRNNLRLGLISGDNLFAKVIPAIFILDHYRYLSPHL